MLMITILMTIIITTTSIKIQFLISAAAFFFSFFFKMFDGNAPKIPPFTKCRSIYSGKTHRVLRDQIKRTVDLPKRLAKRCVANRAWVGRGSWPQESPMMESVLELWNEKKKKKNQMYYVSTTCYLLIFVEIIFLHGPFYWHCL